MELQQASLIISTSVHFVFGNVIEEQAARSPEEIERFGVQAIGKDFPLMSKSVQQPVKDTKNGYDEFEICCT